ncbi:hypothetical protein PSJ8397_02765 [Pseudooctadecabacter jejudonensis]|uniref:Uncharacterized protein n=1 Tax=Pseudooctadecabacter jejudonensis TaxID=1391910 RepID=A0A1Y5T0L5_9RHOB|nr:hypothetical protein PSJ8397_02765 [Pseudooctadecabacter jejudonensis]
MYTQLTQRDIDRIVATARAQRAGAFGRMMANLFRR